MLSSNINQRPSFLITYSNWSYPRIWWLFHHRTGHTKYLGNRMKCLNSNLNRRLSVYVFSLVLWNPSVTSPDLDRLVRPTPSHPHNIPRFPGYLERYFQLGVGLYARNIRKKEKKKKLVIMWSYWQE
jgi:hypothetical protein